MTLIYAFAAFGLAYIVGHSVITLRLREWIDGGDGASMVRVWLVVMLECPACFGFWTGVAASLIGIAPFPVDESAWASAAAWGLFTSGSNYVLARITNLIAPPK